MRGNMRSCELSDTLGPSDGGSAIGTGNKNISKWNILALIVVAFGGGLTLILDQLWIIQWSKTGMHFPVGERQTVALPAGKSLVYYESPHSVPSSLATLQLYDLEGNRSRLPLLREDINYKIRLTGISGRALWEVDIPQPGEYRFIVSNENVLSDEDIPPEDQIVFLKSPNSLLTAKFIQNVIRFTGLGITAVLFIIFYLLHYLTINKRKSREQEAEQFEGEFELEP